MPTKTRFAAQAETAPWPDLEQQAYHALREWPIWLALRERELSERAAAGRAQQRTPGAAVTPARTERAPSGADGKETAQ